MAGAKTRRQRQAIMKSECHGCISAFELAPNRPATQRMRPVDSVRLGAVWEISFDPLFVAQRIVVDSGLLPHELSLRRWVRCLTVKVRRIAAIDQQP
jgi:hypothetical protein